MMVSYVFNVVHILTKDWLKYIVMENGALYAMMTLVPMKLE